MSILPRRENASSPAAAAGEPASAHGSLPVPHYESRGHASLPGALADLGNGARHWRVWFTLSWHDIRQRYRRSVLGPLWLTFSTGIMVVALGLLYGTILKTPTREYLPFLAVGLSVWNLIQSFVHEGCQSFIHSEGFVKQMRLPLSLFAYRTVARNLIIFAHNLVVYLVVAIVFAVPVDAATLLFLPGLTLLVINGIFVALYLGMICARFRDMPQIAASLLQIAFFVTPIIWPPSLAASRPFVINFNPLYYLIEIVRAPLLGTPTTAWVWIGALGVTVANITAGLLFFSWRRHRIAYWV